MNSNEWDQENNSRPDQANIPEGSGLFFSQEYATDATLTWGSDLDRTVAFNTTNLDVNFTQVNLSGGREMPVNPEYIYPISFSFENASWKYVFVFILNILLTPFMCIASKLLNRQTGIRIKNPDYRRSNNN